MPSSKFKHPISEDDLYAGLERYALSLIDRLGLKLPLDIDAKIEIAFATGFMCAKHMVYLKETYGYPLEAYMDQVRNDLDPDMRVDYGGLRHELLMIGTSESSVESMLQELRHADRDWKLRKLA